jgi:hypothetical protein
VKADEIFVLLLVLACVIAVVVANRYSKRNSSSPPTDSTDASDAAVQVSGPERERVAASANRPRYTKGRRG